jgi:hypothetical protein
MGPEPRTSSLIVPPPPTGPQPRLGAVRQGDGTRSRSSRRACAGKQRAAAAAELAFELQPLGDDRTRVLLHFDNEIPRPFNLLLRVAGIVRWTRGMHVKDLQGLKAYAEPPHRTYAGDVAHELPAA